MMTTLLYKQLAALHDEMAQAAFDLQWDKLQALEQRSAKITQELRAIPSLPLDADTRHETMLLIEHILKQQKAIRDEITQWQTDAKPLLTALSRKAS